MWMHARAMHFRSAYISPVTNVRFAGEHENIMVHREGKVLIHQEAGVLKGHEDLKILEEGASSL
jgi:hypothetical protein